jgi:hypothetical protein
VGRRLLGIWQTHWSDPVCHLPGLGDAHYCSVLLEIEYSGMFALTDESIAAWSSREAVVRARLAEHRVESTRPVIGQVIAGVVVDRLADLYVVFDNGAFAAISTDYGWCLWIGELSCLPASETEDRIRLVDWWSGERLVAWL